jgi:thymidine phosphorylase
MEVLANVDIDVVRMQDIVRREKGCLVWGGRVKLSPADDVMITVERPLGIDTPEQMVASILSKKSAAGSTHLLIDMPIGPTAKVRTPEKALRLRKLFEFVGGQLGIVIQVVITDGSQPIGRGIGPVLEARDVISVLKSEPTAPSDLKDRAIFLAGHILEFDPTLKGGAGQARARELLASGAAWAAMQRIVAAQGPAAETFALGALTKEMVAAKAGTVQRIDCYRIARIARLAGAPLAKGSGIDLLKKVGEAVMQGEPLYRIHATRESDFGFASDMAQQDQGFIID